MFVLTFAAGCEESLTKGLVSMSQNSQRLLDTQTMYPVSSSDASSLSTVDTCLLKLSTSSSNSGSISGGSKRFSLVANDFGFREKVEASKGGRSAFEDSDDPFAFDEEALQPSRWDVLFQKNKVTKTQNGRKLLRKVEEKIQPERLMSQQDSLNDESNASQSSFSVKFDDKERSGFIAECLLSAIKVRPYALTLKS